VQRQVDDSNTAVGKNRDGTRVPFGLIHHSTKGKAMNAVTSKSKHLVLATTGLSIVIMLGLVAPREAVAQTRAALVRDIDTPALQPFRSQTSFSLTALNTQLLVTTVPAGKRLVLEYISWNATNVGSAQIVFASLRSSQFGAVQQNFQINPPHISVTPGFTLQDGTMPVRVYFEAGEEVWASVSGTAAGSSITMQLQGFIITP
jgi:hypothetical protein